MNVLPSFLKPAPNDFLQRWPVSKRGRVIQFYISFSASRQRVQVSIGDVFNNCPTPTWYCFCHTYRSTKQRLCHIPNLTILDTKFPPDFLFREMCIPFLQQRCCIHVAFL